MIQRIHGIHRDPGLNQLSRDWKTSALYLFSFTRCSQKVVCLCRKIRQPNTYPPILGKTPGHAGNRKKHKMLQLETSVENFRGQTFWDSEIQKGQITGSSLVFAGTLLTRSTGPQILYTNHPTAGWHNARQWWMIVLGWKEPAGSNTWHTNLHFLPETFNVLPILLAKSIKIRTLFLTWVPRSEGHRVSEPLKQKTEHIKGNTTFREV